MRVKSVVYDFFVHFKNMIENQFDTKIRQFQCDSGGEYLNNKFQSLFSSVGILLRLSCPQTPQQNGQVE